MPDGGRLFRGSGPPSGSSLEVVEYSPADGSFPSPENGAGAKPFASPPPTRLPVYAMAGLQAGVTGVFWMLGCFAVAAFWGGHSLWAVPNLFSTVFYGEDVAQDEFLRSSWAGLALIVFIYGVLGVVWGWWWKGERKPLLTIFGALTGLVTYYLFFGLIWPYAVPVMALYAPVRQLQVAHILWGVALANSPVYSSRIILALLPPAAVPSTPPAVVPSTPPAAVPSTPPPPVFTELPSAPPNTESAPPANQDEAESASGELIL